MMVMGGIYEELSVVLTSVSVVEYSYSHSKPESESSIGSFIDLGGRDSSKYSNEWGYRDYGYLLWIGVGEIR